MFAYGHVINHILKKQRPHDKMLRNHKHLSRNGYEGIHRKTLFSDGLSYLHLQSFTTLNKRELRERKMFLQKKNLSSFSRHYLL